MSLGKKRIAERKNVAHFSCKKIKKDLGKAFYSYYDKQKVEA